jgi:hypothetical protein
MLEKVRALGGSKILTLRRARGIDSPPVYVFPSMTGSIAEAPQP